MVTTLLVAAGLLLAFVVLRSVAKADQAAFNDRFPPISDEEFLAQCPPGTNPVVALKVRRIVSVQMGVDYERIYPSTRFVEDSRGGLRLDHSNEVGSSKPGKLQALFRKLARRFTIERGFIVVTLRDQPS